MYTLAVLWLPFVILEGGMAGVPHQPWWVNQVPVWGTAIILWHILLGHAAYREHTWARWGSLVTFSVYLFLLLAYLLWPWMGAAA